MVEKAVVLLDAFRPEGGPLRLSQLVERSGLPKTTTHRLLGYMSSAGLVEQADDGYYLGRKLFELGSLAPLKSNLREIALPFLQALHESTREIVNLSVRDERDIVYVEKLHGHQVVPSPSRVGDRRPLSCTSGGKAILAFSAPEVSAAILEHPLRRLTPKSIVQPDVLERELRGVRARGIALDEEESDPGCCCVGAPVLVHGEAAMALSVAVPVDRFDPRRLGPPVKLAAVGLTRLLERIPCSVTPLGRVLLFGVGGTTSQEAEDPDP